MGDQIWTLNCKISGNFLLATCEQFLSTYPSFDVLRKFELVPEFDEKNNQTGVFNIFIEYVVETSNGKPEVQKVADIGREILDYFLSLLCFLSGHPVKINKPPEITYHYPNTNKYRRIFFPEKQTTISPPIVFTNTSIFSIYADPKDIRVLSWYKKGLEDKNVVDSFVSLIIALELLANQLKFDLVVSKKCQKCGFVTTIKPGTKQKVEYLIVQELGYSEELFSSIWKWRNLIIHGGFSMKAVKVRELYNVRAELLELLIRGVKKLLGIKSKDLPREIFPGWELTDPTLDVEYSVPESN